MVGLDNAIFAMKYYLPHSVTYNILVFLLVDINECSDPRICGYNQRCINSAGSHWCECLTGYKPDTRTLIDTSTYYHCTGK